MAIWPHRLACLVGHWFVADCHCKCVRYYCNHDAKKSRRESEKADSWNVADVLGNDCSSWIILAALLHASRAGFSLADRLVCRLSNKSSTGSRVFAIITRDGHHIHDWNSGQVLSDGTGRAIDGEI